MAKSYAEKLRDPRWQKKRLEILERDEWMCQRCQDSENTLHVHHLRYFVGKDPWDYDDRLLITLCESCHEAEKEMRKDYESDLLEILKDQGFMADDVYSLASGFMGLRSKYPPEVTASIIERTFRDDGLWEKVCNNYFEYLKNRNANKEAE